MPDVVDRATRSRMMANIKAQNTKPEVALRRLLHSRGFRYTLHSSVLPGRPDIVFPSRRAAIFVHGCFWHSHGCALFKVPGTNREFWTKKFSENVRRDLSSQLGLIAAGWRVAVVWECALRGAEGRLAAVADKLDAWLCNSESSVLQISAETLVT
jgi:DNA mismatch endonuclease, patch repair protein